MKKISKTIQVGWLNLDAWSETYIGARWLIENRLPDKQYQADSVDGPLSQMVLIASHQLVEICLFNSIQKYLEKQKKWNDVLAESVRKLNFNEAFNKWPKLITGSAFPKRQPPFSSVRELASRRNATVHSESALTTLEMANSSLYTAIKVSHAIQSHFGEQAFTYETVVNKYPIKSTAFFSATMYPENKVNTKNKI